MSEVRKKQWSEEDRLDELGRLRLTSPENGGILDLYVRFVADLFDAQVALLSVVEGDRQRFVARTGTDLTETPRSASFCALAVDSGDTLVVPDARQDPRFASNPLVTGDMAVRFYAGALVRTPRGAPIGALCVMDSQPRAAHCAMVRQLEATATLVESLLAHACDRVGHDMARDPRYFFDPLTGLQRHDVLLDHLAERLRLRGQRARLDLIRCDVHNLDAVNHTHGNDAGDAVLVELARRMLDMVTDENMIGRGPQDEFWLVVHDAKGEGVVVRDLLERLLALTDAPIVHADQRHYVNLHFGTAHAPANGSTVHELMAGAGAALRQARHDPALRIAHCSGIPLRATRRKMRLAARLREALARGDSLFCVYQPVVDVASNTMVGVEALSRWADDELGMVSPAEFVPVAHEYGLICELTRQTVSRATADIGGMNRRHPDAPLELSINITGLDVASDGFLAFCVDAARRNGLQTDQIVLELTEEAVVRAENSTREALVALRDARFHVAIDDFGTGYASFAYLKHLPVDRIKLDREFLRDIDRDRTDATIARSLISMSGELGLSVTAEGVESTGQLSLLRQFNCARFQGFLFSAGVGLSDLLTLFKPANDVSNRPSVA